MLLAGCGSGASSTPPSEVAGPGAGQGKIVISVQFPPPVPASRIGVGGRANVGVPIGSKAVTVEVGLPSAYNPASDSFTSLAAPAQTAEAPTGGITSATLAFDNLPAGSLRLRATAWSSTDATGTPIGEVVTGISGALWPFQTDPVVIAGQSTPVTLKMVTLAASITITAPASTTGSGTAADPFILGVNAPIVLTARVMNGAGAPLSGLPLVWSSGDRTVSVNSTGTVTALAVTQGSVAIQVLENNTGLTQIAYVVASA